jgi:hypothetical protein
VAGATITGGFLYPEARSDIDCINYCVYTMVGCLAAQVYGSSTASLVCVVNDDPRNLKNVYSMTGATLYIMNCTGK